MSMPLEHVRASPEIAADPRATSDGELARALMVQSTWAITETWHRFAPAVLVFARRVLGSPSEADDVAQEVFSRVFSKCHALREPDQLRSFIFSFAIRVIKSELRRRKARAWLFHWPDVLPDLGADVLDMESRDLLRRFYALLDRLTPRHRLVFALRQLESMTVEEVAAHTELSTSTIKRAHSRATNKLSCWIEADPGLAGFLDERGWRRGTSAGCSS